MPLPTIEAADFCARYAQISCDGYLGCCTTPSMDRATCVALYSSSCASNIGVLLADPRTGYDRHRAGGLAAHADALVAACSTDLVALVRDELTTIFAGTVAPGGVCTPRSASDLAAVVSCRDGNVCIGRAGSSAWACSPRVLLGMPCAFDQQCAAGLFCALPAPAGTAGTCRARGPIGAACSTDAQCTSALCVMGTCIDPSGDEAYCGP